MHVLHGADSNWIPYTKELPSNIDVADFETSEQDGLRVIPVISRPAQTAFLAPFTEFQ